jgi:thiamine biosynthesis lipoprotein
MNAPSSLVRLTGLDRLKVFEHEAMATTFQLHLGPLPSGDPLRPVAEEAFRLLDRLEEKLSFYREGSDLTRINRAPAGETLRIDELTHRCLLTAMEVAAASDGAFDPWAGHASLEAKDQFVPHHLADLTPPAKDDTQPVIAVDPDQPQVTKLAGQRWLDLGAIGKGAALDALAELLNEWDVSGAVLSAGGSSILVMGIPPDSQEWELALPQSPGTPQLQLAAPFALGASGEGFQPGHIIAAEAISRRPQSLILAPSAALADALATASLLLPDDKLRDLLANEPGFAVFATHAEQATVSTGVFAQTPSPPEICLVIPCRSEAQRLPRFLPHLCTALTDLPVEIIVVDDASPANDAQTTATHVEELRVTHAQLHSLHRLSTHHGKGGAVRAGWKHAAATVRWLGFVDADGAVPPEAVVAGISEALSHTATLPLIAANRYHHDTDKPVQRGWLRQRNGGWFARWAQRQLSLDAQDSQCGFKLVPAAWWKSRQAPCRESGYAFDLELLLAAQTDSLPIHNLDIPWREVPGSHVTWRDGLQLIQTVRRLRKNHQD